MRKYITLFLSFFLLNILNAQVSIPKEEGKSKEISVTAPIFFYDNGGAEADFLANICSSITFKPKKGEAIQIEFSEVAVTAAELKVYYGKRALLEKGGYDADWNWTTTYSLSPEGAIGVTSTDNHNVTSLSLDGKLTVAFDAKTGSGKGWKATVKSVPKPSITEETASSDIKIDWIPHVYKIGSTPVNFFDNGGKKDKISEKFEGWIRFIPTSPNKKIKIKFTKLDLFRTNPRRNDVFKIYNGDTNSKENLVATVLDQATPFLVKSTAADGSLLLTLKSTTGVPKSGFEAEVVEYTPTQMTYSSTLLEQVSKEFIAVGAKNQDILKITINTEGEINPLTVSDFRLSTHGTFTQLSKATLYHCAKFSDMSSSNKLGETVITKDEFSITCNQELKEGENVFWLAYDIKEDAKSKSVVDAGCLSVMISGKSYTVANPQPTGNIPLKSIYYSILGKHSQKVYESIDFTHTENPYNKNKYKGEKGIQQVTFLPGNATKIIKIDFSKFDIYYSSSSYGTKARFEIYNGSETKEENLLWKANADNKSKGPPKALISSASNGALTVIFDAKTTSSYSCGKGWNAVVTEYQPKNMECKEVSAFQASTEDLGRGETDKAILGVEVITEGTLHPLTVSDLVLNLKKSEKQIDKVSVYYTGTKKEFSAASATLVGATNSLTTETAITLAGKKLAAGKSYFWITYNVKSDAEIGANLDAALVSVKVGKEKKTPLEADPVGMRTIKNVYTFKGGNETVNVTAPLMFYDNGGKDQKYSKDVKGTVTFIPKAGELIKIIYRTYKSHYRDHLYIYDGKTTEGKQRLDIKGSYAKFTEIMSMAEDGSLTVKFEPTKGNYEGWEFEVISYKPLPLKIQTIKVKDVSLSNCLRGSEDNKMLHIAVEVAGDKGSMNIKQFVFDETGTTDILDIRAAKLFTTAKESFFSNKKEYAKELKKPPFIFQSDYRITTPGLYNFWLVYDISSKGKPANTLKATLASVSIDNVEATISENKIASTVIKSGFHGTYTVGSSAADYPNMKEAVMAMKEGVDGAVVFNILSGTYDEIVAVPHIEGASAVNTITIKSQTGNPSDVIFENNKFSKPGGAYDSKKYGLFSVKGTDFLTIEGVTLKSTDTDFESLILIGDASDNVTVSNCVLEAPIYTSYTSNSNLLETYAQNVANKNSNNLSIKDCKFTGGYIALDIGGTGYVKLPKQYGLSIENCTFINQGSKSLYIHNLEGVKIANNKITNTETPKKGFQAMDIYRNAKGVQILNNRINLQTKSYAVGIELRPVVGALEEKALIVNNEIIFPSAIGSCYGIDLSDPCEHLTIAHNSILIAGTAAVNSAAIFIEDKPKDISIENNLLQNTVGGRVYAVKNSSYLSECSFSNNAVFTSDNANFAKIGSANKSLNDWKLVASEKNLLNEKANYVNKSSLALLKGKKLNAGKPLSFVLKDITGTKRSTKTPTIGAYEFKPVAMPSLAEGYAKVVELTHNSATMKVKLTENGKFHYIIKKKSEQAPSIEELKVEKAIDATKNTELDIAIVSLAADTEYEVFLLLVSLEEEYSKVILANSFKTRILPTSPSTFEKVIATNGDFEDGTASFSGFVVEQITDGQGSNNKKAAKMNSSRSSITITNSKEGLVLSGFLFKSDVEVKLLAKKANKEISSETLAATNGKWIFISLKEKSLLTSVIFEGTGNVFIDNFSGTPQPLMLNLNDKTINNGESAIIKPDVKGGVMPYSFHWENAGEQTLSKEKTLTITPLNTEKYTLTVTDAWGNFSKKSFVIKVVGGHGIATFENLKLEPESYWWGDNTSTTGYSTFYSGSYSFTNYLSERILTWGGFSYSNITTTQFNSGNFLKFQFHSSVGHGVHNSKNYAICYTLGAPTKVSITNSEEGQTISGFYITNTAWVKHVSENGTGMNSLQGDDAKKPFTEGDWYKITAKGDNDKTLEFYLADYRSQNKEEHYTLDSWQWFDLRALGKVKYVTFKADGTRKNTHGSTIPFYFCMDDFGGVREVVEVDELLVKEAATIKVNAEHFFKTKSAYASYLITDLANSSIAEASFLKGEFIFKGISPGKTSIVIQQTIKGKSSFIKVPIKVNAAIQANDDNFSNTPVNSGLGNNNLGNILSDNGMGADLLSQKQATISKVKISVITPAKPINGLAVPKINAETGQISVPPKTKPGIYHIVYQICEKDNLSNCAQAKVTILVTNKNIIAHNDDFSHPPVNGFVGNSNLGNVLKDNGNGRDEFGGRAATLDDVDLRIITPAKPIKNNRCPFVDVKTGSIKVPKRTAKGSYTISYSIHEKGNEENSSQAVVSIIVSEAELVAYEDKLSISVFDNDVVTAESVFDNDKLNNAKLDATDVELLDISENKDKKIFLNSNGTIRVAANTPSGTYSLNYRICEKLNEGNCSEAKVEVVVRNTKAPVIEGVSCQTIGNPIKATDFKENTYTHSDRSWDITAYDDYGTIEKTYTLSGATLGTGNSLKGVVFNEGNTEVVWTATDIDGNVAVCNFEVKVIKYIDAQDDDVQTVIGDSVVITVLKNDKFYVEPVNTTSLELVNEPVNGKVRVNSLGTLTYTPRKYFRGIDRFSYRVCNTLDVCDEAEVVVYVNAEKSHYNFDVEQLVTPNGDGHNDMWFIKELAAHVEAKEENRVLLFNRKGEKVYDKFNYMYDDELFSGYGNVGGHEKLDGDMYYYVIEIEGKTRVSGYLYLLY